MLSTRDANPGWRPTSIATSAFGEDNMSFARVYWADFAKGRIGSKCFDRPPNYNFITGVLPSGIAVNSRFIFWGAPSGIGRASLDGTDINPNFIVTGMAPTTILAANLMRHAFTGATLLVERSAPPASAEPRSMEQMSSQTS
jgi:hypothetical protein